MAFNGTPQGKVLASPELGPGGGISSTPAPEMASLVDKFDFKGIKIGGSLTNALAEYVQTQSVNKARNMVTDFSEEIQKRAELHLYAGIGLGFGEKGYREKIFAKGQINEEAFWSNFETIVNFGADYVRQNPKAEEFFLYTFMMITTWLGTPKMGTLAKAYGLLDDSVAENRRQRISSLSAEIEKNAMLGAPFGENMIYSVFIASWIKIGDGPGPSKSMFSGIMKREVVHRTVNVYSTICVAQNADQLAQINSPTTRVLVSAGIVTKEAKMPNLLWSLYPIRDFDGELPEVIKAQKKHYIFNEESTDCQYFSWLQSVVYTLSIRGRDRKKSTAKGGKDSTIGKFSALTALEEAREGGIPHSGEDLYAFAQARDFAFDRQ